MCTGRLGAVLYVGAEAHPPSGRRRKSWARGWLPCRPPSVRLTQELYNRRQLSSLLMRHLQRTEGQGGRRPSRQVTPFQNWKIHHFPGLPSGPWELLS